MKTPRSSIASASTRASCGEGEPPHRFGLVGNAPGQKIMTEERKHSVAGIDKSGREATG
jgi:hypothetical protein